MVHTVLKGLNLVTFSDIQDTHHLLDRLLDLGVLTFLTFPLQKKGRPQRDGLNRSSIICFLIGGAGSGTIPGQRTADICYAESEAHLTLLAIGANQRSHTIRSSG